MLRAREIELRKLLSFLVILIIAIALCSCTKNDKTNQEVESNTTENQTQNTYEEGTSSVAVAEWDYSYAIEAPTITDTDVKWNLILVNRDNYLPDNYIETINGVKCHLWEMGVDDLDKQLEFYYVTAVGTGWYIIAIGVALVVLIVLGISYAVIKKQKVVIEENKVDDSEEG